jgi:hypothetical protein
MIGLSHDHVETMLAISLDEYRAMKAIAQEQKVAMDKDRAQRGLFDACKTNVRTRLFRANFKKCFVSGHDF